MSGSSASTPIVPIEQQARQAIQDLTSEDFRVREHAALDAPNGYLRESAARSFAAIEGHTRLIADRLLARLRSPRLQTWETIMAIRFAAKRREGLGDFDLMAVDRLTKLLHESGGERRFRIEAVATLGEIGGPACLQALRVLARDRDLRVAKSAQAA